MLNGLDLFSGIGGMSLALSEWVRPIAYCEIDDYCRGVLLSRISTEDLESAPIWDDIRTFKCPILKGAVDIIYGGFPCQDISVAGNGKGLAGERSGLFFEIMRLAEEIQPTFIFLENVPNICSKGGLRVVREIAERGYDCRWCTLSAAEVGAPHRRERWFLLAYANNSGNRTSICNTKEWKTAFQERDNSQFKFSGYSYSLSDVPHANSQGLEGFRERTISASTEKPLSSSVCQNVPDTRCEQSGSTKEPERTSLYTPRRSGFWETESGICHLVDGLQFRSHRIKSLGNAVVPKQAKEAFKMLMGIK